MATTTRRRPSAREAAERVLDDIRPLLPRDARWDLEYWEGHRLHHLNVFADGIERLDLNAAAGRTLQALGFEGIYMVVISNSPAELRNPLRTARTYPVHKTH
jgi:hypothetical protein